MLFIVLHDKPPIIQPAQLSFYTSIKREAQLPQRDRATRYVSKFVLFHDVWELERFQTATVAYKVIQARALAMVPFDRP